MIGDEVDGEWQVFGLCSGGCGFGFCCGSGWWMWGELVKVMHCGMSEVVVLLSGQCGSGRLVSK